MSTTLELPLEDCIELLTDGGNDAGVDGLYIGDIEEGDFSVTVFQGKYRIRDLGGTANFPENGLQSSLRTLGALFDPYREIALNERIAPPIAEIRSLILDGYIPTVRLVLCNNGARWTEQAESWVRQAREEYGEQVEVLHFKHDAIVRALQRGPHVDTDLTLSGGIVTEDLSFKRVLIGRISVHEIHRLFEEHGDHLLERNVRRFLGHANRINMDIRDTLLNPDRSPNFYFYNNGITAVCDRFDFNALQRADHRAPEPASRQRRPDLQDDPPDTERQPRVRGRILRSHPDLPVARRSERSRRGHYEGDEQSEPGGSPRPAFQ